MAVFNAEQGTPASPVSSPPTDALAVRIAEPDARDLARIARLSRDLVLADRQGAPAEDLRDCAATLIKIGAAAEADLLLQAADLAVGVATSATPAATTWDVAVDELGELIGVVDDQTRLLHADEVRRLVLTEEARSAAEPPERTWLANAFAPALKSLLSLRQPRLPFPGLWPQGQASVELVEVAFRTGPFDLSSLSQEPTELAASLAFNVTRRVLIRRGELTRPPFGDLALFAATERLGASGLGLGLTNLGLLAPTWPELGLLIAEAWRRGARRHDLASTIERLAAPLTIGLSPSALSDLVDTLADAGQTQILAGILLRLRRAPADLIDPHLLRTVRDAMLDLGDLPLAIAAQRRLVDAARDKPPERSALHDLEVSLRNQTLFQGGQHGDAEGRSPGIPRRSGYGGDAARRWRRFGQTLQPRSRETGSSTVESVS